MSSSGGSVAFIRLARPPMKRHNIPVKPILEGKDEEKEEGEDNDIHE